MSLAEQVLELFRGFPFGAPATLEEIQRAEQDLGESLSPTLRDLYLSFNGFCGPTNARFFWPLFGPEGLVRSNQVLRSREELPHEFVSSCVFFGDGGVGPMWAVKLETPDTVILWDARWGKEYEVVGKTPLDAWSQGKSDYDEIADEPVA
ncbi:hypothetical protein CfE428DRAFT_6718 [Chthoniobacter flavus Ellin428]|uniref:Knr4/Smi1-like domain-containing protein n=1 Tax=Chthoniobacter flavus Ellin428 TaxID=497964 RepID=B4DCS7_9BACT|nr:SMI1/KNR4 family protein [Chthoniobacter flavus]EDY15757.1 hypothetical protein CfE428DRAFT_6718 [Chthoniobacter flavus Ellin428]